MYVYTLKKNGMTSDNKFKSIALLCLLSLSFAIVGSRISFFSTLNNDNNARKTVSTTTTTTTTVLFYNKSHQHDEDANHHGIADNSDNVLLEEKEERDPISYYYSWVSNHWIPPKGVPTYTPQQMLEYFVTKNTLFIGDSTGRRFYTTLFAMMTASDIHNIPTKIIDSARVIDVNRGRHIGEEVCHEKGRSLAKNSTFYERLCRNLPGSSVAQLSTMLNNTNTETMGFAQSTTSDVVLTKTPYNITMEDNKGKFDYARMNCYGEVNDYFAENGFRYHYDKPNATTLKKEYDLIVLALGIWEVVNPGSCLRINNETVHDPIQHLTETLKTLWRTSSVDTQFAFRTVGFDLDRGHELSFRMINATRAFFDNITHHHVGNFEQREDASLLSHRGNMILVDWGSAISKRSFSQDRIRGDIKAHYGLEARLLFAQQLMHQLLIDRPPATKQSS
mmetsp:Transcript_6177/g.11697  ORF Transcript_6177/g.11697 Transcript_6177/m.11697 type:complete len:448 (+) Transcript_6177:135-1478(+)